MALKLPTLPHQRWAPPGQPSPLAQDPCQMLPQPIRTAHPRMGPCRQGIHQMVAAKGDFPAKGPRDCKGMSQRVEWTCLVRLRAVSVPATAAQGTAPVLEPAIRAGQWCAAKRSCAPLSLLALLDSVAPRGCTFCGTWGLLENPIPGFLQCGVIAIAVSEPGALKLV